MKLDWKHLLDWGIARVDMNTIRCDNIIQGYEVVVSYKHHGDKRFCYNRKHDNAECSWVEARQVAEATYKHYVAKMESQKSR